jgi:hypothetical protein
MALPDYETLMLPVLKTAADGEVRIGHLVDLLADQFGLSQTKARNFFRAADKAPLPTEFIGLAPTWPKPDSLKPQGARTSKSPRADERSSPVLRHG